MASLSSRTSGPTWAARAKHPTFFSAVFQLSTQRRFGDLKREQEHAITKAGELSLDPLATSGLAAEVKQEPDNPEKSPKSMELHNKIKHEERPLELKGPREPESASKTPKTNLQKRTNKGSEKRAAVKTETRVIHRKSRSKKTLFRSASSDSSMGDSGTIGCTRN